jgi:hypothetical protein
MKEFEEQDDYREVLFSIPTHLLIAFRELYFRDFVYPQLSEEKVKQIDNNYRNTTGARLEQRCQSFPAVINSYYFNKWGWLSGNQITNDTNQDCDAQFDPYCIGCCSIITEPHCLMPGNLMCFVDAYGFLCDGRQEDDDQNLCEMGLICLF